MIFRYLQTDLTPLVTVARSAGTAIMKIYEQDFRVEIKGDQSPVTAADHASNEVIISGLEANYPGIPVISEESKLPAYEVRKKWPLLWLVDPLDGTKEFIKKNGEFTVNIALVEDGLPVAGIVYAPAKNLLYFGVRGSGSYADYGNGWQQLEPAKEHYTQKSKVVVVGSRSHPSGETQAFVEALERSGKEVTFAASGSSLKLCMVAEGKADVYPRFGPTMEWDTAAAHAVALYAGRSVNDATRKTPLTYNKPDLHNPYFIVA